VRVIILVDSWSYFWLSLVISAVGFYFAFTTKLGAQKGDELGYVVRLYGKGGGWILGIGGILVAIRVFLLLTGVTNH